MEKSFFNNTDKKYIVLFPVAIIIGTVFANFSGIVKIQKWNIFSPDYVNRILNVKISFTGMIWYTLKKRSIIFAFLLLGSLTKIKDYILLFICAYTGLASGIIIASLSMQYGVRFLPIFCLTIMIHMIIYALSIINIYRRKTGIKNYLISFLLFLGGVFIETVINYTILPHIILILV